MKKKLKLTPKKGIYCRYSWEIIEGMSITDFFQYNTDLFDNSWNTFAFYDSDALIPKKKGKYSIWFVNGMIVFCSIVHNFKRWLNIVKWDEIGAWYFYTYPTDVSKIEINHMYLQKMKIHLYDGQKLYDYFMMAPEWEFIHTLNPDLAVIKQPDNKLLVIGLNKSNVENVIFNLPWNLEDDDSHPF